MLSVYVRVCWFCPTLLPIYIYIYTWSSKVLDIIIVIIADFSCDKIFMSILLSRLYSFVATYLFMGWVIICDCFSLILFSSIYWVWKTVSLFHCLGAYSGFCNFVCVQYSGTISIINIQLQKAMKLIHILFIRRNKSKFNVYFISLFRNVCRSFVLS